MQPEKCKDRLIAQLEERLAAWRELGKNVIKQNNYALMGIEFEKGIEKLRDLGEI